VGFEIGFNALNGGLRVRCDKEIINVDWHHNADPLAPIHIHRMVAIDPFESNGC
jgi:hypothetical protein